MKKDKNQDSPILRVLSTSSVFLVFIAIFTKPDIDASFDNSYLKFLVRSFAGLLYSDIFRIFFPFVNLPFLLFFGRDVANIFSITTFFATNVTLSKIIYRNYLHHKEYIHNIYSSIMTNS